MDAKKSQSDKLELQKLRKRIEQLEEENSFLEEIISIIPGHVYWKNRKGELQGCNNEQAIAAGLKSRHDIIGLRAIDLIKKGQPEAERVKQAKAIEKVDREVMNSNKTLSVEEHAVQDDGSDGYFISNKAPLHDKKGRVKGLVGVTLNITPQKELEQQLECANKNKSRFILNIGALIRDALSAAIGPAEILNQTQLTPRQTRIVNTICESIHKITPLLNRLYDYVDLEDNNFMITESVFNLKDFFADFEEEYTELAEEKSLKLTFSYDRHLPKWVEGSEYFLSQAIRNLLSNAIKYTNKGYVKLAVMKNGRANNGECKLRIEVEDSGCGISEAAINDLFSLFDNINATNNLFSRPGLDLSITAKMLQLIGANLTVKSRKNKGSIFTIDLALKKAAPLKTVTSDMVNLYYSDDKVSLVKAKDTLTRILILDDDMLWQKAFKLMLDDGYNCSIDQVSAHHDLQSMLKNRYDIIFMDVGFPDGQYLDFASQYKKKHRKSTPPMIVTTARTSDEQIEKINEAAITDVLAKPVSYEQLVDLIDYYVFEQREASE